MKVKGLEVPVCESPPLNRAAVWQRFSAVCSGAANKVNKT